MSVALLPAPAPTDGTRFDWGIVASADPLSVRLNGAGTAVNVANRTREASPVAAGDKVLLMRTGYGGWTYIDRITDVSVRATPYDPITSLQPTPIDPDTGMPTTPGEPPVDPTTGELPQFLPLNAPTNVLIADILWDRFTVTYDYTRNTAPNHPVETGFQVNIIRVATGAVVQSEVVSATTRSVRVGSLAGSVFYRAEVRAITTPEAAFTTYNVAQLQYILSASGHQLSSLYSPWARSPQAQTDDPPVAPVAPPINLRWGSVTDDHLTIHWDYQPLPGFATATGFQVRACQNSLATVGCQSHTAAPTARFQRVTPIEDNTDYWGFVRTVSSMLDPDNPQNPPVVRYSNWVAVGPPRRTHIDHTPEFRNFTIRRAAANSRDIVWSVEVRNATQIKIRTTYQQRIVSGSILVDAGPPDEEETDWITLTAPATSAPDPPSRERWSTITPQEEGGVPGRQSGRYVGVANYTVQVFARNAVTQADTAATLAVRALPAYETQTINQIGNRIGNLLLNAVTLASGYRVVAGVVGFFARIVNASKLLWPQIVSILQGGVAHPGVAARVAQLSNVASSSAYRAATTATAGSSAAHVSQATGIRIEIGAAYVGWDTLEWEVGAATPGSNTFSTDFTDTVRNGYDQGPRTEHYDSITVSAVDFTNIIQARYYLPGSRIRLRTRATNSVGTTPWTSTIHQPAEFTEPFEWARGRR